MNEKTKMIGLSALVALVYTIITFLIFGVTGNSVTFWSAYIFFIIFVIGVVVINIINSKSRILNEIILLGYSIIIWSVVFVVLQWILSTVFMVIDKHLRVFLVIELLLVVIYCIIQIICFQAKETILSIQENSKIETENMKKIKVELEQILVTNLEEELKIKINKLFEKVKYSDIVSSDETKELEMIMLQEVNDLQRDSKGNVQNAMVLCDNIEVHLKQRNVICKNSKKRY